MVDPDDLSTIYSGTATADALFLQRAICREMFFRAKKVSALDLISNRN